MFVHVVPCDTGSEVVDNATEAEEEEEEEEGGGRQRRRFKSIKHRTTEQHHC